MAEDRSLDVVVYGATGFVGKLLAEYLATAAPPDARIGLAGRSESKLEATRASLPAAAHDWPLVVADQNDQASLVAMAAQAQVVATTVGPYRRQGMRLVDACIEAGADYADLTGEVLFVHEAIGRHDEAAAKGVRIVHSVGFDSIPSDLGVLILHEAVEADGAGEMEETTLVVKGMRGGVSGGTLGSMLGQLDDLKATPDVKKIVNDPYALDPTRVAESPGEKEKDTAVCERDKEIGLWLAPFVMAPYNTRIVRRSNGLLGGAYGKRFRYREVMSTGSSPAGAVVAGGVAGGLGGFVAAMSFAPTRSLLTKVLPDPGEGPSEKAREKGFFKIDTHTRTSSGAHYVAHVSAQGDPGYKATAMMMGEAALCLALDRDDLPDRHGILTPATAMGSALVERLRGAGMTLSVEKL
jgi:short subunit dehydrogenase-like uncharacterized protein